jgi:hypothetical protein
MGENRIGMGEIMLITIVAILCHAAIGCREVVVTDSNLSPEVNMMSCQMGEAQIVKWLAESKYADYTLDKWKCVPGPYSPRGQA